MKTQAEVRIAQLEKELNELERENKKLENNLKLKSFQNERNIRNGLKTVIDSCRAYKANPELADLNWIEQVAKEALGEE